MNKIIAGIVTGLTAILFSVLYMALALSAQPNLFLIHSLIAAAGSLFLWKTLYPFTAWAFDF